MYGGKGDDAGSRSGGEGGYSKITFTMEKDVEYVLTGLFSAVNAPFLCRKATLMLLLVVEVMLLFRQMVVLAEE